MAGAAISEPECKYVCEGVRQGIRGDGRGRLDYRPLTVEVGVLPLAAGSSRVTLVTGETEVLVAVKTELCAPDASSPACGAVECDVECWGPAASGDARGAAELNTEMAASLNRCVTGCQRCARPR